jgi:deoxyadenosine/deoxycytidine kinase
MGRIAKRGRKEEKTITMSYLENLESYHKAAFTDIECLLKIDCEEDWDSIPTDVLTTILRFVNVIGEEV